MRLISTSRLAELLGIDTKQIFTYHQRKKINFIKEEKKTYVDLEDQLNEQFIVTYGQKRGNIIRVEDIKPEDIVKAKEQSRPIVKVNDKEKKGGRTRTKILSPVTEYEQHRTSKMKQDADIAKLRLMQMTGRVVPLDQTQMIFAMHFANVQTEFYNTIDNYTVIVVDKLGGTRKDLSEFRAKLKLMVNKAIDNAKEKSKAEIRSKAEEYAKSRKIDGSE